LSASPARAADPLHGNETILLVEDESSLRVLARNLLKSLGYIVFEASSAEEGLHLAKGLSVINVLLTDVVMPGMNGKVLAEQLLKERPEIKVIYMSGYTGQGVGNKGDLCPTGIFLPKPFTREALARKVRTALEMSPQGTAV
jgi:two-component system, cell cycle sensor histidine kinase and response regulator CckA